MSFSKILDSTEITLLSSNTKDESSKISFKLFLQDAGLLYKHFVRTASDIVMNMLLGQVIIGTPICMADVHVYLACFFACYLVYGYDRYKDRHSHADQLNQDERTAFMIRRQEFIYWSLLFSVGLIVWCLFNLPISFFQCFIPVFTLSMLYDFPIFPGGKSLRSLPGCKSLVVSSFKAWMIVFVPLSVTTVKYSWVKVLIAFMHFFVEIFCRTVLWDLRDIKGDTISGLLTVPVVLGESKTSILLLVVLMSEMIMETTTKLVQPTLIIGSVVMVAHLFETYYGKKGYRDIILRMPLVNFVTAFGLPLLGNFVNLVRTH